MELRKLALLGENHGQLINAALPQYHRLIAKYQESGHQCFLDSPRCLIIVLGFFPVACKPRASSFSSGSLSFGLVLAGFPLHPLEYLFFPLVPDIRY